MNANILKTIHAKKIILVSNERALIGHCFLHGHHLRQVTPPPLIAPQRGKEGSDTKLVISREP